MYCGQIGGVIRELSSAKEIIDDMMAEAASVMASFQPYLNP